MTNTALTDFLIAACYGAWLFLVAMSSAWRDARRQLEASL